MTVIMDRTLLPSSKGDGPQLDDLLEALLDPGPVMLSGGSHTAEIPQALQDLLLTIVTSLRAGTAVTIEPHRTLLTTQEAADLLGVSRPTVVRLLESGFIPFTSPGRHRRVKLADILTYQQHTHKQRADALVELADPDLEGKDVGFIETR